MRCATSCRSTCLKFALAGLVLGSAWITMLAPWFLAAAYAASSVGPPSFRYDVLPVLAKHGCSAGSCHGSPNGKGGFRLSLRGFDAEFDRNTLVREDGGRRTNSLDPTSSLILTKPTLRLAHAGGRKLRESDPAYHILRNWIAANCPVDHPNAARCVRIEVDPPDVEHTWPADKIPLRVRAHFSDGTSRDVTQIATLTSSHPAIAQPNADAEVEPLAQGEATIMVRYLEHIVTSNVRFLPPPAATAWSAPTELNDLDRLVFARLKKLGIVPSATCDDHEWLRRVSLDLLGVLPTPEEAERFLADSDPAKCDRLIDRWLDRPEYSEFWAQKWADLLRVRGGKLGLPGVHKFHRWLVAAVKSNLPYDRLVATLVGAEGSTFQNPPANFYRALTDPNDCAEATAQLFLGVRIQCAKCHNHPGDRWSQDDYHGLGAFFSRVQRKRSATPDELIVWLDRSSEVIQPRTGRVVPPALPDRGPVEVVGNSDRRDSLVRWLTARDNPYLARVAVNRMWGHLFGRGLVEPVDDFRADNPPSHPDVLDLLVQRFAASDFDQRRLLRYIVQSRVYRLSSRTNATNADDLRYFSHAYARLLAAEPLLNAMCQATGVPESYVGLPIETRATGLPSPEYGPDFLAEFGQTARTTVCQCERTGDPKLAQALQLMNGPFLADKLRDSRSRVNRALENVEQRVAVAGRPIEPNPTNKNQPKTTDPAAPLSPSAGKSDDAIIRELYLSAYSRPPSTTELASALSYVRQSPDRREALLDLAWAVLNSKEFLFQH